MAAADRADLSGKRIPKRSASSRRGRSGEKNASHSTFVVGMVREMAQSMTSADQPF